MISPTPTARNRSLRRAAALAAATVLSAVLAPAPPAAAAEALGQVQVVRHGGEDRYATSRLIADAFFENSPTAPGTVVVVSGTQWTDAVVAAPLAGRYDAPVLLTPPDQLPADTRRWLVDSEVGRAIVISTDPAGREPNVGLAVTDSLTAAGLVVERVSDHDQFATAIAAARRVGDPGTLGKFGATAIVASGEVFADALIAGPLAARNRLPVLLNPKSALHSGVSEYLRDSGIRQAVLMGGTAALSAQVQQGIEALGITVSRIAGATRFETATLYAAYIAQHTDGCFSGDEVGLARARVPFDALSAAPLLARQCAPAVLTDPAAMPHATAKFLDDARRGRDEVTLRVFGGNAVVSQIAIDGYLAANPDTDDDDPPDDPQPAGAKYKHRSSSSVLPAADRYFVDHNDAIALFTGCEPAPAGNESTLLRRQELINGYSGWDTETTAAPGGAGGVELAIGWWTEDRLDRHYSSTYADINIEWAKQNVEVWPWIEIGFGSQATYQAPTWRIEPSPGHGEFPGLAARLALDGFDGTDGAHQYLHHLGIHAPRRIDGENAAALPGGGGQLLWDWTGYMVQFAPIDREPAAWAMHAILSKHHSACIVRAVLGRCRIPFNEATSPHLRNDRQASPLGIALWNLVCGQPPES